MRNARLLELALCRNIRNRTYESVSCRMGRGDISNIRDNLYLGTLTLACFRVQGLPLLLDVVPVRERVLEQGRLALIDGPQPFVFNTLRVIGVNAKQAD